MLGREALALDVAPIDDHRASIFNSPERGTYRAEITAKVAEKLGRGSRAVNLMTIGDFDAATRTSRHTACCLELRPAS